MGSAAALLDAAAAMGLHTSFAELRITPVWMFRLGVSRRLVQRTDVSIVAFSLFHMQHIYSVICHCMLKRIALIT